MQYSDNAMSTILLCSYIGIRKDSLIKPLSLGEWNQLLDNFIEMKCEPGIVLKQDLNILKEMKYSDNYIKRIQELVSRGGIVAFELDDLERRGIHVVTLFDSDYPVLIKRRLKRKAPPILYYAGDIELSKKIGIAVVGSRNVDKDGIEFTKKLVRKASKERLVIYSGGAKGVDTISEETAIQCGSAVVSFVADSLLSRIKRKDTIECMMKGKLLLISDVKPDAGFSAARAMNRNKLIYASSYGAFVVESDYNKGGTWTGAVETIKNNWTNVFIWENKKCNGNEKLIEKGGIPYSLTSENIYDLITQRDIKYGQLNLFDINRAAVQEEKGEYTSDLYKIVNQFIIQRLGSGLDVNEASKVFNIAKGQMNIWLKRLVSDGLAEKINGKYIKKD